MVRCCHCVYMISLQMRKEGNNLWFNYDEFFNSQSFDRFCGKSRVSKAISIYPAEATECSGPAMHCRSTSSATTRWIRGLELDCETPSWGDSDFIHSFHPSVTLHPSPPRRDLLICTHREAVPPVQLNLPLFRQTNTHTLRVNTIDWKEFPGFNKGFEFEWTPLWPGLVWWLCCVARIGKPRSRTLMFFIHRTLVYSDDPVPVRSEWIPSTHFATLWQFGHSSRSCRIAPREMIMRVCGVRQKGVIVMYLLTGMRKRRSEDSSVSYLVVDSRKRNIEKRAPFRTKKNNEDEEAAACNRGCPRLLLLWWTIKGCLLIFWSLILFDWENLITNLYKWNFTRRLLLNFSSLIRRRSDECHLMVIGGVRASVSGRLFKWWFIESRWQWVSSN